MFQAGVKNIIFYEDKNLTWYHYDSQDERNITNLQGQGQIIVIENVQRPEYILDLKKFEGKLGQQLSGSFLLLGHDADNLSLIDMLTTSLYGWCIDVEYYDGTHKFYPVPVFIDEANIEPHKEFSFKVPFISRTIFTKQPYLYTPGQSTFPAYRFDSTVLTWDSTIYTFDYSL